MEVFNEFELKISDFNSIFELLIGFTFAYLGLESVKANFTYKALSKFKINNQPANQSFNVAFLIIANPKLHDLVKTFETSLNKLITCFTEDGFKETVKPQKSIRKLDIETLFGGSWGHRVCYLFT